MSKEKKKSDYLEFMKDYFELIEPKDTKELYDKLKETSKILNEIISLIKEDWDFIQLVLSAIIESEKSDEITDPVSDLLSFFHIALSYESLMWVLVEKMDKKIKNLKKKKQIKAASWLQLSTDNEAIKLLASTIIQDMVKIHDSVLDLINKYDFDDEGPQYEIIKEIKKIYENIENTFQLLSDKLFEFKI